MNNDIAVVGAGPAGAWAAYSLARRGASVVLMDPSHPREKPCGGGVTGRALDVVAKAIDLAGVPTVAIRSARFTASSSDEAVEVPLEGGTLIVASRAEFDGVLLQAARRAGAEVLSTRVIDVRAQTGGFRIDTMAGPRFAGFLIGADGANSLLRRRLAHPFRRDQLSIATGFFAHGVTSDEIVIELIADPPGYVWSFPRATHLAVGICAQADSGATAGALRHAVASWLERTGLAEGARLEPYAWPIPSLPSRDFESLELAGLHWCLVGDAAGLVDPITREGIYFALLSGQWAADAITSSGADRSRRYADQVRDEIIVELARAARFKAGFFRPRFTHLMIETLRQSAAIRAVMADLVAGRQDYAGLKWRLAKTLEFGPACRLVLGAMRSPRRRGHMRSAAAR